MSRKQWPLVSIVVPVYNIERDILNKCVDSLINQTLEQIEIILVDDGSEGKYAQYAYEASQKDKRIRFFRKSNGGVSTAKNMGIDNASAEYIMFVDSDDWIDEDCCEYAYKTAVKTQADIVMWRYIKEFTGKSVEVNVYPDKELDFDTWKQEFNPFDMRLMGMCCMKLYTRKVIGDSRFDDRLTNGEDVELNFRIFEKMRKSVYINKAFYHYRQGDASAVRMYKKDMPERYDKTIMTIAHDVNNSERMRKYLKKSYYAFVGISYLMLNMNHIFSPANEISNDEKMAQLKLLSSRKPYKAVIAGAEGLELPITRKMALIFAKYRFYYGVYFIMMVKSMMNRSNNT